jgi:tetratricopeptide (TPR) repeat protein
MTEVYAETEQRPARRQVGLNLWLNIALGVLLVGILGGAAYFGYSYYRDQQADLATTAGGRLAALLTAQVRKNPNDVILRVRLGEALGGMGKYADATEQLNAALKIEPKHIGAHLDLGLVALASNDPSVAESYFKKVVELTDGSQYAALNQSREVALYNLGLLAMEKKQYGDAAGYFKAALVVRKDASDTYYQLAKALQGMGEVDGAIQQLEIGLKFDPGFAEAHYFLGQLYKEKKDDVNASYQFVKAAELAPDGDPPREAVEAFGPASKWVEKSRASLAADNIEEALTSVLIARNLDQKSFDAAKLHAEILIKRGSIKDALDVYRQAAAIDASNAEVKAQIAALEPQVAALLKQEAAKAKPKK